jgi:hypothetical protein
MKAYELIDIIQNAIPDGTNVNEMATSFILILVCYCKMNEVEKDAFKQDVLSAIDGLWETTDDPSEEIIEACKKLNEGYK